MVANFKYISEELQKELVNTVSRVIVPNKGIFIAYESPLSLIKYSDDINGSYKKEFNYIAYYELIFTKEQNISEYISSIVLDEEAFNYRMNDGELFSDLLKQRNLIIGIKMYKNFTPICSFENEFITEGLDNLTERCRMFKKQGFYFANWSCIFSISKDLPSYQCIVKNAEIIACYAAICQSQRIVPMISALVIQEGNHDLEKCQKVTEIIWSVVCRALMEHRVFLEGVILRTNIVTPGMYCVKRYNPRDIAIATVTALRRTIPSAFPAIVFSFGCFSEKNAITFLDEIFKIPLLKPWIITFAYSQAFVSPYFINKTNMKWKKELLKNLPN